MQHLFKHTFPVILTAMFILGCNSEDNNGYASIAEGTTVAVPALTGGKILSVSVQEGEAVRSGALLALIDTTSLVLQRAQLTAGLAELSGQTGLAQTQLKQAMQTEQYVQEKHDRISRLVSTNAAAQQSLDDLSQQLQQAGTAREAARQNFQIIAAKREQLNAQLALLQKSIRDARVLAPADGILSERYYEPGEAIPAMSPIVEIIQIDPVEIKIYVSETLLAGLNHNQPASVYIDGRSEALSGVISWISPRAEFTPKNILTPETRTSLVYAVIIRVANPNGMLKHGMPATVKLGR